LGVRDYPKFVHDGKVNAKGLGKLSQRMPFADLSKLEKNPEESRVTDLLSVPQLARFIQAKLGAVSNLEFASTTPFQ
jgi:hypothetical protein